jgi:hypothetical protein
MSATGPIQSSIAAKLLGDSALVGLVTGVFDFRGIPPDQAFPYVTIGDSTEVDDSVFGALGYDTTFTLHIWSIQPGAQECQQILSNLNRLLNHQPLVLTGFTHVGTWYDMAQTMSDPDDTRITHMPVRYRIEAQEAA